MDLSLSVVLPVHNVESTLVRNVSELLDVLPEIAARFEILIVDDGSTDHTEELAHELARQFPQVRVVRHGQRRGRAAAQQAGMVHARGDVVFVHDEASPIRATALRALWNMRFDQELVAARAEAPQHTVAHAGREWAAAEDDSALDQSVIPGLRGTQMFRRQGLDDLTALEAGGPVSRRHRFHAGPHWPEPAVAR